MKFRKHGLFEVCGRWLAAGLAGVLLLAPALAMAERALTFIPAGQLSGGQGSRLMGVSPDGTIAVGEAVNASNQTVAVIYDLTDEPALPALTDIGFLDAGNPESKGRGISVDANGVVHICGNALNSSAKDRGFYWSGDRTGTGTFQEIVPLSGDDETQANELFVDSPTNVFVVGTSYPAGSTDGKAFRWRSDSAPSPGLYLGNLRRNSRAIDIGGSVIVGWSDSTWQCTGNSTGPEAFHWSSSTMFHNKGLDWVCGGEPWQTSAGPDQTADTHTNADNVQVVPVGTTGLTEPDAIVISAGPDNRLKDQLNPSGDDIEWPLGNNCKNRSWSVHSGISSNGRYRVGASSFPEEDCSPLDCADAAGGYPRQAHMRDVHNRDHFGSDNCGGIGFLWPLGFLPGDNMSEALAVSNGGGPGATDPRSNLVVVGWSRQVSFDPFQWANEPRAFACFIKDQEDPQWNGNNDLWFLRHEDAGEGEPGASAASRFKGMRDLKAMLADQGVDMTGWDLREARSVSDNGGMIVGWGVHNGIEEGFIVEVEVIPDGACCVSTGFGTGTCSVTTQEDCVSNLQGTYLGDATVCGTDDANCEFCPTPFGDADGDGDMDQKDFAAFQKCLTALGEPILPGCSCFDRNDVDLTGNPDGSVTEEDFNDFMSCATGPEVLFDPLDPPPNCNP